MTNHTAPDGEAAELTELTQLTAAKLTAAQLTAAQLTVQLTESHDGMWIVFIKRSL